MLKDIKNTTKHSFIYSFGNIGIKLLGLLLIPYYTNQVYLSHEDYGALALLEATLQVVTGIMGMAMASGLQRWYWDKQYITKQTSIFFTAYSFLLVVLIPLLLLLFTYANEISKLIFGSTNFEVLLKLTFATAALKVINGLTLTLLKLKSKSVLFATVQLVSLLITFLVIIGGLVYKNMGLDAIWIGYISGELFVFISLLVVVAKNSTISFEYKVLRQMFNYGLPLMLTSVAGVILLTTDRYMLNSLSGLVDTGVYSLGARLANTLKIVVASSIISALTPLLMKKIDDPNNQRYYSKIMTYSSFVFTMALLALALFSLDILKLFARSSIYWESAGIVAVISYSLLFGLMRSNANIGLIVVKDTRSIGLLTLVTTVVNILLNYWFIPIWNIYGAASATLLSQFLFLGLTIFIAQKQYHINYEWRKLIIMVVLSALFVAIGIGITEMNVALRLLIKSAMLLSFPFILFLSNFYEEVEVETIKSFFKDRLKRNDKRTN